MKRLSWVEPGEIDALARDFFIHALVDMGACYILYDQSGLCICITSLPPRWQRNYSERPTDLVLFGPELASRLSAMRARLVNPGDKADLEIAIGDESIYEFRSHMVAIPGKGNYVIMSIADRSEERQRAKTLHSLLLEVSHRSKNLLAIVQGIASHTARFTGNLDDFLAKFRGRLYALAQSQDLVTASSWRGADFLELAKAQIGRYTAANPDAITLESEPINLTPNAATHLGLALHELVVNAITNSEILTEKNAVLVQCHRIDTPEGQRIKFRWVEKLRPNVIEQSDWTQHFSSTVLQRIVPAALGGYAVNRVEDNCISYELTFPLEGRP
ncbi:sensor histidine kinase [Rhizobium sp. C4]|uniref:sensor histidine kinase n=1 Tax=Rhizobium sp. C4 TaxID=1349800 RepID=UPI001E453FA1|nr:sensor histidine kinase [Rhizobium sp. C4]MCD2173389.1 sensor histidine kinase [Rhizobium sp. C4]